MNEHIRKANDALEQGDRVTARAEFSLALGASDSLIQRIAKNRLRELALVTTEPLQIDGFLEPIIPRTRSRCCGARALFVLSREGGFVASLLRSAPCQDPSCRGYIPRVDSRYGNPCYDIGSEITCGRKRGFQNASGRGAFL